MAVTLSGVINLNTKIDLVSTGDVGDAVLPISYGLSFPITNGTGANQANEMFTDTRQLAASGTEDLDLADGLTDAFGNTLTFTKVKALIVQAAAGNTNNVIVGGAAANGFTTIFDDATDQIVVRPGGAFALIAPDATAYAVTEGTGDLLTITNSAGGTTVDYTIVIIGTV